MLAYSAWMLLQRNSQEIGCFVSAVVIALLSLPLHYAFVMGAVSLELRTRLVGSFSVTMRGCVVRSVSFSRA